MLALHVLSVLKQKSPHPGGFPKEENVNGKKGFSLTEILTTVVILAVLAAIAIPGFSKSRDKAAANQAIAYLRTIRLGEKMYFAKNATYIDCSTKALLLSNLGVEVTEENYKFDVTGSTATAFSARARKGTSSPANCTEANTICLDQAGVWSGGYTSLPTS